MCILGIDPGRFGAIAHLDSADQLTLINLPHYQKKVGGKLRPSIDPYALCDILALLKLQGATHAVLEKVGARPKEGAVGAFSFGHGRGVILGALAASGYAIEEPTPQVWKKALDCPSEPDSAIVARADSLFPNFRHLWRGPKGGQLHDRAEAAMLALWGKRQRT